MKKRQREKKIRRRLTILTLEILFMIILIVYVKVRSRYEDVFYENTIINGVDCSLLTIEEAREVIQHKEDQYVFEIIFRDNEIESISGTEIKFTVEDLGKELNDIKERQRKNLFLIGGRYDLDNLDRL